MLDSGSRTNWRRSGSDAVASSGCGSRVPGRARIASSGIGGSVAHGDAAGRAGPCDGHDRRDGDSSLAERGARGRDELRTVSTSGLCPCRKGTSGLKAFTTLVDCRGCEGGMQYRIPAGVYHTGSTAHAAGPRDSSRHTATSRARGGAHGRHGQGIPAACVNSRRFGCRRVGVSSGARRSAASWLPSLRSRIESHGRSLPRAVRRPSGRPVISRLPGPTIRHRRRVPRRERRDGPPTARQLAEGHRHVGGTAALAVLGAPHSSLRRPAHARVSRIPAAASVVSRDEGPAIQPALARWTAGRPIANTSRSRRTMLASSPPTACIQDNKGIGCGVPNSRFIYARVGPCHTRRSSAACADMNRIDSHADLIQRLFAAIEGATRSGSPRASIRFV